jgi:RNA-directed DNA polymerase
MLPAPTTHLLEEVLSPNNLNKAWKKVKSNKGAPGIDGLTIDNFQAHFKDHGPLLVEDIRQGNYQPYPVKRVYIKKDDGSLRGLGIPTVFDRLIQQAILQVIIGIFDPTFSEFSYGFRPKHSQHQAVRQVQEYVAGGKRIAVDVDLSKFFDRVNHDLLMSQLGKKIQDKSLLKLIYKYLRAGIVENGVLLDCREGVPQGGPLSPLLSNIVLDPLDKELEKRGHTFARWADDFIILVNSKRAGDRVLKSVTQFVERKLKLKVNDQKSRVVPTSKSKFLGFTFRGKSIAWHPDAERKFKREIKRRSGRSAGISMQKKIHDLTVYMRGWINYFGITQGYQKCIDLDAWIRRRLRMCYWKQWRKVRTKVRNLMRLGVSLDLAISSGMSSKSYWHSARTPGINIALSNEYLAKQGYYSLRDRWVELHYGKGTADCGAA